MSDYVKGLHKASAIVVQQMKRCEALGAPAVVMIALKMAKDEIDYEASPARANGAKSVVNAERRDGRRGG